MKKVDITFIYSKIVFKIAELKEKKESIKAHIQRNKTFSNIQCKGPNKHKKKEQIKKEKKIVCKPPA